MGAYERHRIKGTSLFIEDIEVARLRKKSETNGGLHPMGDFLPEHTSSVAQAEALFWSWVLHKVCPVKELQAEAQWEFILIQRDLRGQFAHLVVKRQLVTEMESSTTFDSLPGAGLPAPITSVKWGIPATSLAAGAPQRAASLKRHAPRESGARRPDQEEQAKPSLASEYEAQSFLQDEVRQPRARIYAIEIALDIGLGDLAATQFGKPTALDVLCQDVDALGRETQKLYGRVNRRVPASALKELRRSLDAVAYEAYSQMTSYDPHWGARSLLIFFCPLGGKPLRTIVPFKTPHVIHWEVDGIGGAVPAEDPNGSGEAMLQLITPNGANQR
ncbi:LOW QUALITY PROTEIN: ATP-binding cassette (ABC) Superfamily [Phytophthora palmivora]|uniref:ATP-binding cassette (ABC) Superfamily n=1 Tax=Phytophthora palmivora TaxID=4796 RepID=A0A2P4YD63_9STRA|nr:LOW QUALITY PROTEIN: ATP-binding cassette (ABC) Superfamily [Phytophthora palmivora]